VLAQCSLHKSSFGIFSHEMSLVKLAPNCSRGIAFTTRNMTLTRNMSGNIGTYRSGPIFVVECGGVWWSVVECGGVWWSVVECGRVWWSVVECGGGRVCNDVTH
jgi:hypothetical protein